MSATTNSGWSSTMRSISLMRARQLSGARHRRLHGIQKRSADAGLLELADGGDGGAARRGHRLAQLDRVHAEVAQLLRRAEHRLHDERGRDLARDAEQDARLDHRLGEK